MICVNINFHRATVLNYLLKFIRNSPIEYLPNVISKQKSDFITKSQLVIDFIKQESKLP